MLTVYTLPLVSIRDIIVFFKSLGAAMKEMKLSEFVDQFESIELNKPIALMDKDEAVMIAVPVEMYEAIQEQIADLKLLLKSANDQLEGRTITSDQLKKRLEKRREKINLKLS